MVDSSSFISPSGNAGTTASAWPTISGCPRSSAASSVSRASASANLSHIPSLCTLSLTTSTSRWPLPSDASSSLAPRRVCSSSSSCSSNSATRSSSCNRRLQRFIPARIAPPSPTSRNPPSASEWGRWACSCCSMSAMKRLSASTSASGPNLHMFQWQPPGASVKSAQEGASTKVAQHLQGRTDRQKRNSSTCSL